MNEEILVELLSDIQHENIRFGYCEVCFTFHDNRIVDYQLTIHRKKKIAHNRLPKNICKLVEYDEKRGD